MGTGWEDTVFYSVVCSAVACGGVALHGLVLKVWIL